MGIGKMPVGDPGPMVAMELEEYICPKMEKKVGDVIDLMAMGLYKIVDIARWDSNIAGLYRYKIERVGE